MLYTENELQTLIQTVEKEFTAHLRKTEEAVQADLSKSETVPLVKAEDAPPKKDKKPADDKKPAPAPKEDEAPTAENDKDAVPAPAPKEGEVPAPAAAEGQPPVADKGIVPDPQVGGDESGYDAEDMEHMYKMYASMSKSELKAHHDVIMKIAQEQQAAPAPDAAVAPAPAAAPAPAMDKCGEMNMGKTEDAAKGHKNGGEISAAAGPKGSPGKQSPASKEQGNLTNMEKSENTEINLIKSELDAEKAKFADLKKSFDAVQEFITKLTKVVPQGKAITSMEQISKSESVVETKELSKSEITSILNNKVADQKLSKSDRDAVNAYYLDNGNINTISHLLK